MLCAVRRYGLVALAVVVLFPAAFADGFPVEPTKWTGSVSSSNAAQVVANGAWGNPGGFTLNWVITQNGSIYHYAYTITAPVGDTSHWIMEAGPDATSASFFDITGASGGTVTTHGISAGNPGIPGNIFGIKWDGNKGAVSFSTELAPGWGHFYAKNGEAGGQGTNYAYNAGFGTVPSEPFAGWIPVPTELPGCEDPQNCVYVSNYTGGQILAVDRDTGGISILSDLTLGPGAVAGARPEDTTVGPDDRVYACLPENGVIVRVKRDGSGREVVYQNTAVRPQGARFNFKGDLIFTTEAPGGTGVWLIPGAAFKSVAEMPAAQNIIPALTAPSGAGMAFLHDGDLLIVDRANNRVLKSSHPSYGTVTPFITANLDQPTGIAVDRRNQVFVSNGGAAKAVRRFSSTGAFLGDYAQFVVGADPQTPNYLEIIADNTMFVATADSTLANGRVFRVEPGAGADDAATVLPLAKLRQVGGDFPAASGMGVGGTTKTLVKTFSTAENSQTFNFGPYQVEFTSDIAGTCDLTVTAKQLPAGPLDELLEQFDLNATTTKFSGEEGRDVTFEATKPACFGADTSVYIAGFYDTSNPRTARYTFDGGVETAQVLQLLGFYPLVLVAGDLFDPGTNSGTRGDWSDFGLVDQATVVNGVVGASGAFCGFSSPLTTTDDPTKARTFNSGQNVTVKFQIGGDATCKKNFITVSTNLLSVARIFLPDLTPTFDVMVVEPSGSSVPNPPIFRFSEGQYSYTLNTTGYPPGYYQIIVVSDAMPFVSTWIRIR